MTSRHARAGRSERDPPWHSPPSICARSPPIGARLYHWPCELAYTNDTIDALAEREMIERVLHYQDKDLPENMRSGWLQLRGMLVGTDFHSRMERYVALDVFEDKIDEKGELTDRAEPEINKLADEAIKHQGALAAELQWLVREAANGFRFGYALGKRDESRVLLPGLVDAQRAAATDGNAFFNRPGPRLVESLEIMAACVHPELFQDFARAHAPAIERVR